MTPNLGENTVIVTGLPRSGTSMMMQMLHTGGLPVLTDTLRTADPDNPKGYFEYEPVKKIKTDRSWLDLARGKAVKMVHLLLYDLPADRSYQVILMRRNIDEILASQTAMLQRMGKKGAALPADQLAATFTQQLDKAQRWLDDQVHINAIVIHHHDILTHPQAQALRISDFLGGQLDVNAMAETVDPTLYRQRLSSKG